MAPLHKRPIRLSCFLAVLVVGFAFAISKAGAQEVLRLIQADEPGSIVDSALEEFARTVAARTGGGLSLEVVSGVRFPSGEGYVEALRSHEADLALVPVPLLARELPGIGVFDLFFLFDGEDAIETFMRSPGVAARLFDPLTERDVIGLGFLGRGFESFVAHRSLRSPEDFAGLQLRVPPAKSRQLAALGASPLMLPFAEVAPALTTGAADGAAATLPRLRESGWAQALPTITHTRHAYSADALLASANRLEDLEPGDRRILLEEALDFLLQGTRQAAVEEERTRAELGGRVLEETERAALRARVSETWTQLVDPELVQAALRANGRLEYSVLIDEEPLSGPWWSEYQMLISPPVSANGEEPEPEPPEPAGPFWNAWFAGPQGLAAVTEIAPEQSYTLTLDLAAFDFAAARPSAAIGGPAAAPLRQLLDEAWASGETKVGIWVRPVLLGVSAPRGAPLGRLIIDIAKLRRPSEELTRDYERLQRDELDLPDFAVRARAAVGEDGQPYRLTLRTGRIGCAAIAFSLWDDSGLKPIDQVIVRFRVGPGADCPIDHGVEAFAAGLESLLATMLGELASSAGIIDAALHVFEFEGMIDGLTAVALYVERTPAGFVTHSWRLGQPLTPYLGDPVHFPKILKDAQDAAWRGEPAAYAPVSKALSERVFSGYYVGEGDEGHDEQARAALDRLRALADRVEPARVLARLVNSRGEQVYLPLRLLAAGGSEAQLPRPIDLVQPLPREAYVSARTCVEPWRFALPERIEGVEGAGAALLAAADRGPTTPWLAAPVLDREALRAYFAQRPRPPEPEGLLLLAHQATGGHLLRVWCDLSVRRHEEPLRDRQRRRARGLLDCRYRR